MKLNNIHFIQYELKPGEYGKLPDIVKETKFILPALSTKNSEGQTRFELEFFVCQKIFFHHVTGT